MAASIIQSKSQSSTTSYVGNIAVTLPTSVSAGNFLVAIVSTSNGTIGANSPISSIGDNKSNGWSKATDAANNTDGSRSVSIWYAANVAGGATTVTINFDGYYETNVIVQEYSGVNTTAPLDKATAVSEGSAYATSHTAGPTGATTIANELVIGAYVAANSTEVYSAGAGVTNLYNSQGAEYHSLVSGNAFPTTTGTQSMTFNSADFVLGATAIATFKAGAAAVVTPPPGANNTANWYPYGTLPTGKTVAQLRTIAQNWWTNNIKKYIVTTGMPSGMPAGAMRVQRPENSNDTVSEGMGYVMVGAVYMAGYDTNAQTIFDNLYKYVKYYLNPRGLMAYRINSDGSIFDAGAATDADADIAWALHMAAQKWGSSSNFNYATERDNMLNAMLQYEFYSAGNSNTALRNIMIDGDLYDTNQTGTPDVFDPDYFSPLYFQAWSQFNTRWMSIRLANYGAYTATDVNNTGLIPDHQKRDGSQSTTSGLTGYTNSYNAVRRFRQVIDYLNYGSTLGTPYSDYYQHKRLADFVATQSSNTVANMKAEWNLAGTANGGYINATFVASYMVAMLVNGTNSQLAADSIDWIVAHPDGAYFGDTVAFMSLLTAAGYMTPAYAGTTTTFSTDYVNFAFSAPAASGVKTHTSDFVKRATVLRNHSTDIYGRRAAVTTTKNFSTDVSKRVTGLTRLFTTNVNKRAQTARTQATDVLKRVSSTRTNTTDVLKRLNTVRAHTTDVVIRKSLVRTHNTDVNKKQAGQNRQFLTDVNKKKAGILKSHTTDTAMLFARRVNIDPNPRFVNSGFINQYGTGTKTITSTDKTIAGTTTTYKIVSDNNGAGYSDGGIFHEFALSAGTYTFSVDVMTGDDGLGDGMQNAHIAIRDSSNTVRGTVIHITEDMYGNYWRRYTYTFTQPTDTIINILMGIGSYGATSQGMAWFTNMQLEAGSVATPFFDGASTNGAWRGTPNASQSYTLANVYTRSYSTDINKRVRSVRSQSTDVFKRLSVTRAHTTDANFRKTTLRTHATDINLKQPTSRQDVYYFDASDAPVTNTNNTWTNPTYAFDNDNTTAASSSMSVTPNTGGLTGYGTTAPTSGGTITQVEVRVLGQGGNDNYPFYSDWGTITAPSNGWTFQKVNDLQVTLDSNVGDSKSFGYAEAYIFYASSYLSMVTWNSIHSGPENIFIYKVEVRVTSSTATQYSRTHTTSVVKRAVLTRQHSTDVVKRVSSLRSHSTDTLKRQSIVRSQSTDVLKRASSVRSHSTDVLKRVRTTRAHSTDLVKRLTAVRTHGTDVLLELRTTRGHFTDITKRVRSVRTQSTDFLKRVSSIRQHSTDLNKRAGAVIRTHSTDVQKRITLVRAHTTDVNKRKSLVITHATDVNLRKTNTRSQSTDIVKRISLARVQSTDVVKRAALNRTHATDVIKRSPSSRSQTTDVVKRASLIRAHATDTNKRLTGIVRTHSTDTVKRIVVTRAHSTDVNKRLSAVRAQTTDNAALLARRINLIGNPTFETDFNGWAMYEGASYTRVASDSGIGSTAVQITNASANGGSGYASGFGYNYDYVAGITYNLSFYVKAADTSITQVNIYASIANNAATFVPVTTSWTRVNFTFTATVSQNSNVRVRSADLNKTFFVDGFLLEAQTLPVRNASFNDYPLAQVPTTIQGAYINGTAGGQSTDPGFGGLMWGGSGNASALLDSSTSKTGPASLKLSTKSTGTYIEMRFGGQNTYFGKFSELIYPGYSYNYTFWMKTNVISGDSNSGAYVNYLLADTNGNSISAEYSTTPVKVTQDWTQYSISFTAPKNAAWGHFEPRIYGHNGTGTLIMDAWFDDFVLNRTAPAALPYFDGTTSNAAWRGTSNASQSYTNTYQLLKLHNTDTFKRLRTTRSHATDVNKRINSLRTHSTDVLKRTIAVRIHATDVNKRLAGIARSHSTDVSRRSANIPRAHSTEIVKRSANITRAHSTDALKRLTTVRSHSTDIVKAATNTRSFSTDVLKRKAISLSHSTSTNKRQANIVRTHSTDVLKRLSAVRSYSTDTVKRSTVAKAQTTDVFTRRQLSRSQSIDIIKRVNTTRIHSTDVNKRIVLARTQSTDVVKRSTTTRSHPTDVNKRRSVTPSHTTDVNKRLAGIIRIHSTDVLKRASVARNHSTDINKRRNSVVAHATDGFKRLANGLFHVTDVNKRAVSSRAHSTNTVLRKTYVVINKTDINLRKSGISKTHATDVNKRLANVTRVHNTDVNKRAAGIARTQNTDTLKRAVTVKTHSTDINKRAANITRTHSTDIIKRKATTRSYTSDVVALYQRRINLVLNPSVETNLNNIGSHPNLTITRDNTTSVYGSYSVRVTDANTGGKYFLVDANNWQVGKTYTFSASLKQTVTGGKTAIGIRAFGASGIIASSSQDLIGTQPWTRIYSTLTLPAGTTSVQWILIQDNATAPFTLNYDGFMVEEVKPQTFNEGFDRYPSAAGTPTTYSNYIVSGNGNDLDGNNPANNASLFKYRWMQNIYQTTAPYGTTYDVTTFHGGSASLKFIGTDVKERVNATLGRRNYGDLNDPLDIRANLIPVYGNVTYTFGIWYKQTITSVTGTPNTTNAFVWLAEHSATGYTAGTNIYRDDNATADWRYKEITFTTNANTRFLNIFTGMTGNSTNYWSGTLWIDDITLVATGNLGNVLPSGYFDGDQVNSAYRAPNGQNQSYSVAWTPTPVHSTDVVKRSSVAKSHLTDIVKRYTATRVQATDVNKRTVTARVHSTDTLKRAAIAKAQTADVVKRAVTLRTHSTDVTKRTNNQRLHATDVNKRLAAVTRVHGTSINKRAAAIARQHSTDLIKRAGSVPRVHTTDVIKRAVVVRAHSTDVSKRQANIIKLQTTDIVKRANNVKLQSTDVNKKAAGNIRVHSTDALKRKAFTRTHATDVAMLFARRYNFVPNPNFEPDMTSWSGYNSNFARDTTQSFYGPASAKVTTTGPDGGIYTTINYKINTAYTQQIRVKGTAGERVRLQNNQGGSTYSPYFTLTGGWDLVTFSFTTTANNGGVGTMEIKGENTGQTFYLDGAQVEYGSVATPYFDGNSTNGAWRGATNNSTSYTQAIVYFPVHLTDIVKRLRTVRAHTTDFLKRAATTRTHATDINKRTAGLVRVHTTSVNKRAAGISKVHATDINKRKATAISHATNINKRIANVVAHSTDITKRKVNSKAHATDVNKRKPFARVHTTDVNLRTVSKRTHATDIVKRLVNAKMTFTDIVKRQVNGKSHGTSVNKRAGTKLVQATDVNKRKLVVRVHSTDVQMLRRVKALHFTDATFRAGRMVVHSTSVGISGAKVARHTTDVYIDDGRGKKRVLRNGTWLETPVFYLKDGTWTRGYVYIKVNGNWEKTPRQ